MALGLLLVRSALSQMDVPTRTSYVMAVVTPAERTAAASVTAVPRSLAHRSARRLLARCSPTSFSGLPLVACGVLKIVYDLALLYMFRHVKPPEERVHPSPRSGEGAERSERVGSHTYARTPPGRRRGGHPPPSGRDDPTQPPLRGEGQLFSYFAHFPSTSSSASIIWSISSSSRSAPA